MTPRWLSMCVVTVVLTTALMSISWWSACTFFVGPRMFDAHVQSGGKIAIAGEVGMCRDVSGRSLAILSGLLATLLGLMSNPPQR